MIVLLLTAAVVGPFLIDWNGFKPTFERQASEILGQEVHILGDAELRLLPTPSLTFDNVTIGEAEGRPLATVERVAIRMELLPFLSGEIAITEMTIERPEIDLVIDDSGRAQLVGAAFAPMVDDDRVSLNDITITNGVIRFQDARTGAAFELVDINTNLLEAPSLIGPWRVDGSLVCVAASVCGAGTPVTFNLSTGRVAGDGSFRLNVQLIPASLELAGTLTLGGTVAPGDNGLVYSGNLRFEKLAIAGIAADGTETLGRAWNVSGSFRLDGRSLALDAFTFGLDTLALTGNASLTFGSRPEFVATIGTPQIDLNTLAGAGPAEAVGAADAGRDLMTMIRTAPATAIPGRISISIPSVIMADAALQDFTAEIRSADGRWEIPSLSVRLPGASQLTAEGTLVPGEAFEFAGRVTLESEQPDALASWWSGTARRSATLRPFAITATGSVVPDRIALDALDLTIGLSHASGRLAWATEDGAAVIDAAVEAETFDVDQLIALYDVFAAANPAAEAPAPAAAAPRYDVALDAAALRWGDVTMAGVGFDIAIADRELAVERLAIADLDGAAINVASGRVSLDDATRVALEGTLTADRLDGVVALATKLWPEDGTVAWLAEAADLLVPLDLTINANPLGQLGGAELQVDGTAAGTEVTARAAFAGAFGAWADAEAELSLDLDNPDAAALLRQAGLAIGDVGDVGPADLSLVARGVPDTGLTINVLGGTLGPLSISSGGSLRNNGGTLSFEGPLNITADDFVTGVRLVGINLAAGQAPVSAVLRTSVVADADGFTVEMLPNASSIAAQGIDGRLVFADADGLAVSGTLNIGTLDLGWLMALPLGIDPTPTGDPEMPWSTTAFSGPVFGDVRADVDLRAARVAMAPEVDLVDADIGLALRPDGGTIDLRSATLAGGQVTGTASVSLASGQALLEGRLTMSGVDLSALVWRRDGQPVAEGRLDLNAGLTASGRSPAGLIASLGGDLTISIRDGAFAFLNEAAFGQALDLIGENPDIGDIALRDRFTTLLDGGRFAFAELTAPLDVFGGYISAQRLIVDGTTTTISMQTLVDLNLLAVDSTWELASLLDPAAGAAPRPSVGINFRGPLTAPARTISIAGLTPYLRYLQAEERDRLDRQVLEQEFFLRLIRRAEADRLAAPAAAAVPEPVAPAPEPVVPEPVAPAPIAPAPERAAPTPAPAPAAAPLVIPPLLPAP